MTLKTAPIYNIIGSTLPLMAQAATVVCHVNCCRIKRHLIFCILPSGFVINIPRDFLKTITDFYKATSAASSHEGLI
jgi:hypothetical protein